MCGDYDSEEVKVASDRLLKNGLRVGDRWFFYTAYYYAQGMYQRGDKHAAAARKQMADLLIPIQSREGWWDGVGGEERQGGKVYATSLAVLVCLWLGLGYSLSLITRRVADWFVRRGQIDGPLRVGMIGAAGMFVFSTAMPLMPTATLAIVSGCVRRATSALPITRYVVSAPAGSRSRRNP